MKKLVLVLIFFAFSFAGEYSILYNNAQIGTIKSLDTIQKGYLVAKPHGLMKSFSNYDTFILHTKKPNINFKNPKYKYDKHHIIEIIQTLQTTREKRMIIVQNKVTFDIECNNNICSYKKINQQNGKINTGEVIFKGKELIQLTDDSSNITIVKRDKVKDFIAFF